MYSLAQHLGFVFTLGTCLCPLIGIPFHFTHKSYLIASMLNSWFWLLLFGSFINYRAILAHFQTHIVDIKILKIL